MPDTVSHTPAPEVAEKIVYLSFFGGINQSTSEHLIAATFKLIGEGYNHIYYLFSTTGGDIAKGITLYNVLKGLPVKITMHNAGSVDSIGNSIFLAAKNRIASPHSTFMFHGVAKPILSATNLDAKQLKEYLDAILVDQKRIVDIITEQTSLERSQVEDFFNIAATKDARWAQSVGYVQNIQEINPPSGVRLEQLVFPT